jgi:VWFA-related protein
MRGLFRIAIAAVAAWVTAGSFAAQTRAPQTPVIRTAIELVTIDAVVRDKDNKPVRGLTRDDFEITDLGDPPRAYEVATFEEAHRDRPAPRAFPSSVRLDVADNQLDEDDRLVVFAIDDTHIRKEWTAAMRKTSRDAILRLGPGSTMVLLSTSGKHRIEATSDIAVLLAQVDRILGLEEKYVVDPPLYAPPDRFTGGGGVAPITSGAPPHAAGFQSSPEITLNVLGDAARALSTASERRKAFVWISSGLMGGTTPASKFFVGMLEKMRQANVAVYPLDPIGTGYAIPGGAYDGIERGAGKETPWDGARRMKHRTMTTIAERTGGLAFINNDDIDAGIERIADDLDNYYLLGFYPDTTKSGYQNVSVRVKRPGLTVRHRDGFDLSTKKEKPSDDPLKAVAASGVPVSALPLRMFAAALPAKGGKARVPVAIEVGGRGSAAETRFELFAVDQDRMKVVANIAGRSATSVLHTQLSLAPGRYQLRALVFSGDTRGSVFSQLVVPNFATGALTLGSLIISRAGTAALAVGGFPVAPGFERSFTTSDSVRVYGEVTSRTPVAARVMIVNAMGRVVSESMPPVVGGRMEATVRLAGLEPGAYGIRVRVEHVHGDLRDEREVGILVTAPPVR